MRSYSYDITLQASDMDSSILSQPKSIKAWHWAHQTATTFLPENGKKRLFWRSFCRNVKKNWCLIKWDPNNQNLDVWAVNKTNIGYLSRNCIQGWKDAKDKDVAEIWRTFYRCSECSSQRIERERLETVKVSYKTGGGFFFFRPRILLVSCARFATWGRETCGFFRPHSHGPSRNGAGLLEHAACVLYDPSLLRPRASSHANLEFRPLPRQDEVKWSLENSRNKQKEKMKNDVIPELSVFLKQLKSRV